MGMGGTGAKPVERCGEQCDAPCTRNGRSYSPGYAYLDDNDCSTCLCTDDGWVCDSKDCLESADCRNISQRYTAAMAEALSCSGDEMDECDLNLRPSALPCGCTVGTGYTDEIDNVASAWGLSGCAAETVECPLDCLPFRSSTCTGDGLCAQL
jgi:hypothetical protein